MPNGQTVDRIFDAFREMAHIDTDKGQSALALGIRDSSIDLSVKIKKKKDKEKITIYFPIPLNRPHSEHALRAA